MALDPNVQKYISTFIQGQFPRLYDLYGQGFIDFLTAYYQWMETQGPLYDSRRLQDYQDIDITDLDRFLVYFKDKYLPNIQLETVSNVDLLVKHSLDVYRSRGTLRAIDLLFRLVFGVGATVYYPFDDVFQPSSGEWIVPLYIEVSTQDDLNKFVGKEIVGVTSGATAFCESWVRKRAAAKIIDVLYISLLRGNFIVGERINIDPLNLLTCPTIIGSLTDVNLTNGGSGFSVGDIVDLQGTAGYGGTGRVANVSQITGTVNFNLVDGGYGYTANSQVLVSQYVLSLTNVVPGSNVSGNDYFTVFETIKQPMATINYQSAVGGHFANNDTLTVYYGNGTPIGTGTVLASANGNSTNGVLTVAVLSGNLAANSTIYNQGNAIHASIPVSNGYIDITATGNVIAESLTATFTVSSISGNFIQNETIIPPGNTGASASFVKMTTSGVIGSMQVKNRAGVWTPGSTVTGLSSGATATISLIAMNAGVINATGTFIGDTRAPLRAAQSNTTALLPALNQGSGASFTISPTLLYPETVSINTDYIYTYAGTQIGAVSYGFPAHPAANVANTIATCLTFVPYTVGRISALVSAVPGQGYTVAPLVRVLEPISFPTQKLKNRLIYITGATSAFAVGDLITQGTTNARGLILSANSSQLLVQKMSLFNTFIPTVNGATIITSTSTGTTANVVSIVDPMFTDPEQPAQVYLGLNADIEATTSSANGTITSMQVLDSGWGYEPGETITMTQNGVTATGEAVILNQGQGQGFYRTEDGFLSDIKKIHDNDYYQVSAYDVRSSIAFEHYKDMLNALLHVAGTRAFGTFVHQGVVNNSVSIQNAIIIHG